MNIKNNNFFHILKTQTMKNFALLILAMAILPFTAHTHPKPPQVEATVYASRLQTLVLPGIAGSQQITMNADPLEGYTDKQLADELRRRGYEVDAKKVTNI